MLFNSCAIVINTQNINILNNFKVNYIKLKVNIKLNKLTLH